MTHTSNEALRKTAVVPQPVAEAFRLFIEDTSWWPLESHSVGGDRAVRVTFGRGVGEQIVEHMQGGETSVWGTITGWEPPTGIAFTWHPGTPVDEATEVALRFRTVATGTEVELIHTGWDLRPNGATFRRGYDVGWDFVFGRYAEQADGALAN